MPFKFKGEMDNFSLDTSLGYEFYRLDLYESTAKEESKNALDNEKLGYLFHQLGECENNLEVVVIPYHHPTSPKAIKRPTFGILY
jgi:hypothetical protein